MDKHSAGFYVEVKKDKWGLIEGIVKLRRRSDRKVKLGELRLLERGNGLCINAFMGELEIAIEDGEYEPVINGMVVRDIAFTIKDDEGTETRIRWFAGDKDYQTEKSASPPLVIPGAEELDFSQA